MTTRNRWVAGASAVAVVLALVIWLAAAGGDDGSEATTTSSSTTTDTTSTTTATTAAPTTTEATTTTTATPGPGPVTVLEAYPGAGSGEIELAWGTIPGATGYRVLRADAPDGTFTTAVEIDVTTGAVTDVAEDVTNVWSEQFRYLPASDAFTGPDTSPQIRYVEYSFAPRRCFRVVALGPEPGPESATVCGSPP